MATHASAHAPRETRGRRDGCWALAFVAVAVAAVVVGVGARATTPRTGTNVQTWTALRGGGACFLGGERAWRGTLEANKARMEASATRVAAASLGLGAGKGLGKRSRMMIGSDVGAMEGSLGAEQEAVDAESLLRATWPWIVTALVASVFMGIFLMHALKNHSKSVVWGVMYAKVGVLAVVTIASLAHGALQVSLLLAFLTLLSALVVWMWRDELNLVASMIAVSTQSLSDNPHLVSVTMLLQLGVLAYILPLAWFAVSASQHGSAAINKYAIDKATTANACVGYYGQVVDCCTWELEHWVGGYFALVFFAAMWVFAAALECRMYVVGGVVSQWYFAPAGTTNFKGTTKTSLRNAFGPSFGTICYGGFVITAIEFLKAAAEKARRENRGNLLMCCLSICLECIYNIIEYITRFAMIQASMSGEAFCDAARTIADLLQRNFLLAYGAYYFPQTILGTVVLVLSGLFGYSIYTLSDLGYAISGDDNNSKNAIIGGCICFVVSYIVLTFVVMILLNVVDAVFVCYAVDKDRSTIHHPDLHQIFNDVTERQTAKQRTEQENDDANTKYSSV